MGLYHVPILPGTTPKAIYRLNKTDMKIYQSQQVRHPGYEY